MLLVQRSPGHSQIIVRRTDADGAVVRARLAAVGLGPLIRARHHRTAPLDGGHGGMDHAEEFAEELGVVGVLVAAVLLHDDLAAAAAPQLRQLVSPHRPNHTQTRPSQRQAGVGLCVHLHEAGLADEGGRGVDGRRTRA